MLTGGRILNYVKKFITDERTDILFVGYQANGTPGHTIQKYGPGGGFVRIEGENYNIRARIHTITGYSAHADQKDLINFVKRMRHKPKEIRLVHGDKSSKQVLKQEFMKLFPSTSVVIPRK